MNVVSVASLINKVNVVSVVSLTNIAKLATSSTKNIAKAGDRLILVWMIRIKLTCYPSLSNSTTFSWITCVLYLARVGALPNLNAVICLARNGESFSHRTTRMTEYSAGFPYVLLRNCDGVLCHKTLEFKL